MKSTSPLDSARNGFETLVKLDRTDSGKLNVPSPHGSFQRTQSFIKQILAMKTDLNALFPTENKDKTSNISCNNNDINIGSPGNDSSDVQYSSSRSYGMYRKRNSRSVKLAPLTPEIALQSSFSSSTKSSIDVTPASSKRLTPGAVGFACPQSSPADHSRLWQEMMLSPTDQAYTQNGCYETHVKRSLRFSDHDELISDNCSVMAVQSDDDYHNIHDRQSLPLSSFNVNRNHKKSVSMDTYDDLISKPNVIAPLRTPLPHIIPLHSSSMDTACLQYNYHTTISQAPSSWSSSTDVYDEMNAPFYQQIRTKSFNGEGLVMDDREDVDEKSIEEGNQTTQVVVRVLTDDRDDCEENRPVDLSIKVKKQVKHALFSPFPSVSSTSFVTPELMLLKSFTPEDDCMISMGTVPDYDQQADIAEDEDDNDEDLIPNDPDEDGDDAQCEVECYLQSYCLGKETSVTTALQALQHQQEEQNDRRMKSNNYEYDESSPVYAAPVPKKSIKARKATGKMVKKLLTMTSFDDDDDDDDANTCGNSVV